MCNIKNFYQIKNFLPVFCSNCCAYHRSLENDDNSNMDESSSSSIHVSAVELDDETSSHPVEAKRKGSKSNQEEKKSSLQ